MTVSDKRTIPNFRQSMAEYRAKRVKPRQPHEWCEHKSIRHDAWENRRYCRDCMTEL